MGNIHDPFMNWAVRRYDSVQVFDFRSVISQRTVRHIGYPASGFSQNGFGPAGVPKVGTVPGMHVQMGACFTNNTDL